MTQGTGTRRFEPAYVNGLDGHRVPPPLMSLNLTDEELVEVRAALKKRLVHETKSTALWAVLGLDVTGDVLSDEAIRKTPPHKLAWFTGMPCRLCGESVEYSRYSRDLRQPMDRCLEGMLDVTLGVERSVSDNEGPDLAPVIGRGPVVLDQFELIARANAITAGPYKTMLEKRQRQEALCEKIAKQARRHGHIPFVKSVLTQYKVKGWMSKSQIAALLKIMILDDIPDDVFTEFSTVYPD